MSMLSDLQAVLDNLQEAVADADKFDKGNGAAGTRLRKTAMNARNALQDLRKNVQETKNSRK